MIVGQILEAKPSNFYSVPPDRTVAETARLMAENNRRFILVADAEKRLKGVVSTMDIVHALGEKEAEAAAMPIAEIMTEGVEFCTPEDLVDEALNRMSENRVRHLPVLDGGLVRGVINLDDALEFRYREEEMEASQIKKYVFRSGYH